MAFNAFNVVKPRTMLDGFYEAQTQSQAAQKNALAQQQLRQQMEFAPQEFQLKRQQIEAQAESQRATAEAARRKHGLSILGGLANVNDEGRRAMLYPSVRQHAISLDPSLEAILPPEYDPAAMQMVSGPDPRAKAMWKQGMDYDPMSGTVNELPGYGDILADRKLREAEIAGQRTPAAEQKISRIMDSLGLDRATAVKIADGVYRVATHPVTGENTIFDLSTGQPIVPGQMMPPGGMHPPGQPPHGNMGIPPNMGMPPAQPGVQPPQGTGGQESGIPDDRISLYSLADKTAGAFSGAVSLWNATAAQIPGIPANEQIEQARQTMSASANDLVRSLSINPRFPVSEMERISDEVKLAPSSFDSPPALRARMKAIDQFLRTRLKDAQADTANRSLPSDIRKAQASNAAAIESFLRVLDVPQKSGGGSKKSLDEIFGN